MKGRRFYLCPFLVSDGRHKFLVGLVHGLFRSVISVKSFSIVLFGYRRLNPERYVKASVSACNLVIQPAFMELLGHYVIKVQEHVLITYADEIELELTGD